MSDLIRAEDLAKTIVSQQEEINALKAKIDLIADYVYNLEATRGETIIFRQKTLNFIEDKTPQQCLADVRADVIKDFKKWCLEHHKMSMCSDGFLDQLRDNIK